MAKSMNVGIIGCGNISAAYMELSSLFKGIKVVACADMSMAAAEARAKGHITAPNSCTSLRLRPAWNNVCRCFWRFHQ